MEIVATLIMVLSGIYFVVLKRKTQVKIAGTLGFNGGSILTKTGKSVAIPRSPWRATSIVHDHMACDAAKAISDRRFLDNDRDTPLLPLPGCTASQCNCRYSRHHDRRDTSEDRRAPSALQSNLFAQAGKTNRRARKRGRRKTDWA